MERKIFFQQPQLLNGCVLRQTVALYNLYFLDKSAILEDEIFSGKYTLYEFRTIAQRF